jgi:2-polyprenyl-3-methyl-5-hydroxy-6-metoxy-1,4-benzoquinol methylase
VYLDIKSDKNEIESYYSSSNYRKTQDFPVLSPLEHFRDKVTKYDTENRFTFISNNLEIRNKEILEIGSASGSLLKRLIDNGAKEAVGVELDKEYSKYARNQGLSIYTQPIEELNFRAKFDAIISFHTLEHVYNPKKAIRAINMALKSNGSFIGEVPNQNDWRIQVFNDEIIRRLHYDPNHYYYFSPSTLKKYLMSCGFNRIKLETVERYNSILQLERILCKRDSGKSIEDVLKNYLFPKDEKDDVRLPDFDDKKRMRFNNLFEKGVNSELMGNCLRWIANKK